VCYIESYLKNATCTCIYVITTKTEVGVKELHRPVYPQHY